MATDTTDRPDRVTRVVTLPIRGVEGDATVLDTFRPAWRLATDLANWAQLELACRDSRRAPGMDRFPAYDRAAMFGTVPRRFNRAAKGDKPAARVGDPQVSSLYALWSAEYPGRAAWDGSSVSARDVLTAVEKTWVNHKSFGRFAVMWKGEARAATFRFPYPWPVPADKGKTLRVWKDDAGRPHASFPLPGGRVAVRLADGREFRRQLRQFDTILADVTRLRQAKVTGRWVGDKLVGADLRLVAGFDAAAPSAGSRPWCPPGRIAPCGPSSRGTTATRS